MTIFTPNNHLPPSVLRLHCVSIRGDVRGDENGNFWRLMHSSNHHLFRNAYRRGYCDNTLTPREASAWRKLYQHLVRLRGSTRRHF